MSKREIFIMVDTEFSGPTPGKHSLLSIGAVIVGQHTPPYAKHFYTELQPLSTEEHPEPEAMAVNGLDYERLKREGESPMSAMSRFTEWVWSVVPREFAYPVMVSDGTCDYMWIRWYFCQFAIMNPFVVPGYNPGGNTLDMKSFVMGKHQELKWAQTRSSVYVDKYPQYKSEFVRTHNALADVLEQADRFHKLRQA